MKKTDQGHTPSKIRPHRLRALLSSCIAAVFAVTLAGFCFLNAPASEQDASSIAVSGATCDDASATKSQVDATTDDMDADSALDVELGYVHDEMILSFERGTSASEINEQLASLDCVATKDVSAFDLDSGHVTVDLVEGTDVKDAIGAAQAAGFTAQPNFVYTLAEGEAGNPTAAVQEVAAVTPAASDAAPQSLLAAVPRITRAPVSVNDTSFGQQWALASVDAQKAWAIERCGVTDTGAARNDRVSIAVIDTGIVSHEDLDDNVVAKYNSYNGAYNAKFDITDLDENDVTDKRFHGTHVAGIASAVTNNNKGVAAVSYNAGLVAIKVTDDHGNTAPTDSMVKAYDWLFSPSAADSSKTNAEYYNVRVVNMSLCGNSSTYPATDEELNKAIEKAHTGQYNGTVPGAHPSILTVTAAGNSSNNQGDKDGVGAGQVPYIAYPSDCANTISVINLLQVGNETVAKSESSNYNMDDGKRTKNISAPGTSIYSTWYSGPSNYGNSTGTSMAAPLVSGIAALVFSERPELSAQDVTDIIYASATDLGDEGWDRETGYGEINAYHALQLASAKIDIGATPLEKGDTAALTITYADGSGWETYGSPDDWEWKSSDDGVATVQVDQASKVVTVAGVGKGTATITATLRCADGKTTNPDVIISESVQVELPQVQPASIEDVVIADIPDQTYMKPAVTPTPTVTHPDFGVLVPGTDFNFVYENNANAGTARLRVVGIGNYSGMSAWKEFTINKRSIEDAQVTIPDGIYTGDYVWPEVTVTLDGVVLAKGYDYKTGYYFEPIEIGTYDVEIEGANNFTGKISAPFSIVEPPKPEDPKPNDPQPSDPNPSDPTKPDNSGSAEKQTMWRLYNPNSGEHFYTASVNEREALRKVGWAEEGEAWTAPKTSKTPVYRLYSGTDHHYTTSAAERDMLVKVGWKYEGIGWYSDDQKRVPLHRLYNPNVNPRAATNNSGSHHYTKHALERDALTRIGWKYEDVGWYGM